MNKPVAANRDGDSEASTIPSPEELIARARAMAPILLERAPKCEELRRLPDETVAELRKSQLLEICKPKMFGGFEYGYDLLCEVVMELAKGCASTAWTYGVYAEHNNMVAAGFNQQCQEEIWADQTDAMISSGSVTGTRESMSKACMLTRVDGGYRVTGQTTFSSGCDHADWLTTRATFAENDGPPLQIMVPMSEGTIMDNWDVFALRGTGSKIVDLKDVFVPEHRTVPNADIVECVAPGAKLHEHPIFHMPWHSMRPFTLVSVAIGGALGAVEQFNEGMKSRINRFGESVAQFQSIHLRVAESAAEAHAAKTTALGDIRDILDRVTRGEEVSDELKLRNKRDQAYCSSLAAHAVERLFYAAGANALFSHADIQRKFRDVHAARSHQQINWDIYFTAYGRDQLGLDTAGVRF